MRTSIAINTTGARLVADVRRAAGLLMRYRILRRRYDEPTARRLALLAHKAAAGRAR